MEWFAGQPTLEDAISTAAHAVDKSGRKLKHQCREPLQPTATSAWTPKKSSH
jgi:hypothetical protein